MQEVTVTNTYLVKSFEEAFAIRKALEELNAVEIVETSFKYKFPSFWQWIRRLPVDWELTIVVRTLPGFFPEKERSGGVVVNSFGDGKTFVSAEVERDTREWPLPRDQPEIDIIEEALEEGSETCTE